MKTKSKLNLASSFLVISLFLIFSTSCNKDDGEKISAEQIRQALFDMKGRYHGAIEASFYQGTKIIKIENVEAISRDSLTFIMPLEPITSTITDEKVVDFLRNINTVEIKARYNFYQIDDNENIIFLHSLPKRLLSSPKEMCQMLQLSLPIRLVALSKKGLILSYSIFHLKKSGLEVLNSTLSNSLSITLKGSTNNISGSDV